MQSSRSEPVLFKAIAADDATEVFLIDGRLKRIASGVGRLEAMIEPGFYKVRFRSGASQYDELVEVSGKNPTETLQGKPINFWSAAPIANTATTRPKQAECASNWSRREYSNASSLFVFLRQESDEQPINPDSVSIFDLVGDPIAHLTDGQMDADAQCAGLNLDLDPGTYRLRVSTAGLGDYEMFVTLCKHWQTQVFLTPQTFERGAQTITTPSLRRASVFMTRLYEGFDPDNPYLRLTELAKKAMSQGRNIASRTLINRFLSGKFQDPVMGLVVAHLLLRRRHKDTDLINTVLNNLDTLIGDHPDLIALRLGLRAEGYGRSLSIERPPIFAASWQLMTRATRVNASLIAPDSVPGHIAHNVANSDSWLLHRVPEMVSEKRAPVSLAQSKDMFRDLLNADISGLSRQQKDTQSNETFSGLEQSILNMLRAHNELGEMDTVFMTENLPQKDFARALKRIPAPAYSIATAVQSLHKKIDPT